MTAAQAYKKVSDGSFWLYASFCEISPGMLRPVLSTSQWCEQYGLEPFTTHCRNCGKSVEVSTPVAFDSWRGIASEVHDPCGERYQIVRSVSIDEEIRRLLLTVATEV